MFYDYGERLRGALRSVDLRKPDCRITDAGRLLRQEIEHCLIGVTVDEPLGQAAVATIKLRDEEGAIAAKGDTFAIGNTVEVELGYVGKTERVFVGEVTAWRGGFTQRGRETLTVVCQDRFHRLRRNRRQKTFLEQTDAAIVQAMSAELRQGGVNSVAADATPVTHDCVIQWNQTDADFILERAALHGYVVYVDDRTLRFKEPDLEAGPAATAEWHRTLYDFRTSISLTDQQDELQVTAWNMADKKPVQVTVTAGDERSRQGGTVTGGEEVDPVKARAPTWSPNLPAKTEAEAEAYAKGLFYRRAERFLEGKGTLQGDPKLRRDTVLEVEGIGEFLSGPYYVRRVVHSLLPGSGYTTTVHVTRSAVQRPAPPPPPPQGEQAAPPREEPPALLDPAWDGPGPMAADSGGEPVEVAPGVYAQSLPPGETDPEAVGLKMRLQDEDGGALAGRPYTLEVGGETFQGETDAGGKLAHDVPAGVEEGRLTIQVDDEDYDWPLKVSDHTG